MEGIRRRRLQDCPAQRARPPKIGFWVNDIAATRTELLARGAKLGKLMSGGGLTRCEGKDPDGNPFSISDRP